MTSRVSPWRHLARRGRAVLGLLAAAAVLSTAVTAPRPLVVWNLSPSAPLGAYHLQPARTLRVGDWLALRPRPSLAAWLAARGYLPDGALLIKQIAALPPSVVCREGDVVRVDHRPAARAAARDRLGRPLPVWRGCRRLAADEVFLLNPTADSLDSRYLGPAPRASVFGRLQRLPPPPVGGRVS